MNKEEVKLIIQLLKEHVDGNEELLNNSDLSHKDLDQIRHESSVCCKAINELSGMQEADSTLKFTKRYLVKWNKLLNMNCINSKGMVKNDIQYVLKKIKEDSKCKM